MAGNKGAPAGTSTTPPLATGIVGNRAKSGGPNLAVHLKILTKREILELLQEFDDEQKFLAHHVEGSMVSLTISPTRGGND